MVSSIGVITWLHYLGTSLIVFNLMSSLGDYAWRHHLVTLHGDLTWLLNSVSAFGVFARWLYLVSWLECYQLKTDYPRPFINWCPNLMTHFYGDTWQLDNPFFHCAPRWLRLLLSKPGRFFASFRNRTPLSGGSSRCRTTSLFIISFKGLVRLRATPSRSTPGKCNWTGVC